MGGYAVCGLGQQGSRAVAVTQKHVLFGLAEADVGTDECKCKCKCKWVGETCRLIASGHDGGAEGLGPRLAVRGRRSYWQSWVSVSGVPYVGEAIGCTRLARAS